MKNTIIISILVISCSILLVNWKSVRLIYELHIAKLNVLKLSNSKYLKDGDLIFQTSLSKQSSAIQFATKSKYSHCGLIFKKGEEYEVLEAVQPVKVTPLYKWIARGQQGHFVVKRLKNASSILTPIVLIKMKKVKNEFMGKNCDLTFEWSDEKIYCSELIWKIYERATGIKIGELNKLKDFDLSNPIVKTKMQERYGDKIPLDEPVISPKAIFDSNLLITVKSN